MSELQLGELAAVATAMLWTLSALAWTYSGRYMGALAVSFLRLPIAGVMLMIYGYLSRGLWFPTDASAHTWLLLGASGITGFVVCDLCLIKAFLLIGPRVSLLIFSLAPPMSALLASVSISDSLGARQWLAMAVTLAGVVWVVLEQPTHDDHPRSRPLWGRGVALAILAAATHALGYVFSKEGIGGYDAGAATLIRATVATVGYVIVVTLSGNWPEMLAAARQLRAMGVLTIGAAIGPFAGVVFSMIALRNAPTGVVATIIATMPVLILPFSIFIHHEKVSPRAAFGAVVAVAGVAMLML
jgi:drug/metabolite transporter (DMT)-like permease